MKTSLDPKLGFPVPSIFSSRLSVYGDGRGDRGGLLRVFRKSRGSELVTDVPDEYTFPSAMFVARRKTSTLIFSRAPLVPIAVSNTRVRVSLVYVYFFTYIYIYIYICTSSGGPYAYSRTFRTPYSYSRYPLFAAYLYASHLPVSKFVASFHCPERFCAKHSSISQSSVGKIAQNQVKTKYNSIQELSNRTIIFHYVFHSTLLKSIIVFYILFCYLNIEH